MPWPRLLRSRTLQSAAFFVAVTGAALLWVESIGGPDVLHLRYGLLAPAFSVPVHLMLNVTPVGELVPWSVANGVVYGFLKGALLSWLAWMGAATIQYLIARRARHEVEVAARLERLPRWLRRLPIHHPLFLIAGRWVPLGGPLINLAAGAFGVRFRRLFVCAATGYAPEALLNAAIGAELLQWL